MNKDGRRRPTKYDAEVGNQIVAELRAYAAIGVAAERTGIGRSTAYHWIALGEKPDAEEPFKGLRRSDPQRRGRRPSRAPSSSDGPSNTAIVARRAPTRRPSRSTRQLTERRRRPLRRAALDAARLAQARQARSRRAMQGV